MCSPGKLETSISSDRERDGPFCIGCNYDLRHLTEPRCPECGRPFDPDNGATFALRPLGLGVRILLRIPTWLILVPAVVAVLLWFASYTIPGRWATFSTAATWIWLTILGLWPVRLIVFRVVADFYFLVPGQKMNHRPWALAATVLMAMSALSCAGFPNLITRGVFRAARPALEQLAISVYSSKVSPPAQWIGLYNVAPEEMEIELLRAPERGGGSFRVRFVYFSFERQSQEEDIWLVYCPEGDYEDLTDEGKKKIIPLGGKWYEVR